MRTIKIYLSHAIRGAKGPDATNAEMQTNINAAMRAASIIRQTLRSVEAKYEVEIEIYCPADHDEFVMIAYRGGFLDEAQILAVDCAIVERCQALIWYSGLGPSGGAEIEMTHARANDIPTFELPSLETNAIFKLEKQIEELVCQEN
jgi:hypothetical protein